MTNYDAAWVAAEEAKRAFMDANSCTRPRMNIRPAAWGWWWRFPASRRRKVVENGIKALKAVWHRGAVDADGKTGDGAGIHVQIPVQVLLRPGPPHGARAGHAQADRRGAGVPAAHRFRRAGALPDHRGNRSPADGPLHLWLAACAGGHEVLGEKANATRPEIEQILIRCEKDIDAGAVRARAVHHPPPDREGGDGGADPGDVPVLPVLPQHHLQGHDAGRAGGGLLSRPDGRTV